MSAYLVENLRVTNPEAYREYPPQAAQTVLKYGGEVLAADDDSEVVEGDAAPLTVVIRFPSKEAAREWYRSPEYQRILPLRTDNAEGIMVFVDEFAMPEG